MIVRPTVMRDSVGVRGYECRTPDDPPGKLFMSRADTVDDANEVLSTNV